MANSRYVEDSDAAALPSRGLGPPTSVQQALRTVNLDNILPRKTAVAWHPRRTFIAGMSDAFVLAKGKRPQHFGWFVEDSRSNQSQLTASEVEAHNASPHCTHGTPHCPIGMRVATLDREQLDFEIIRR